MRENALDIGKGDFAQIIADAFELRSTEEFVVPSYLEEAIRAVLLPIGEAPAGDLLYPDAGGDDGE